ncbi:uncharacterized protein KY384_004041 [Bacidia gigantensis]|uniref:uncharacterized protein n=1 Tax=Bacidia gigantensis TaxID=2732470 RepID=UPI001D0382A5|nr:uncharacterized protein KY384_004041 [Bacidia gigantensis]KAG8530686.1 hypothetical protein KY384_004041 [Bacidia gigantensis]
MTNVPRPTEPITCPPYKEPDTNEETVIVIPPISETFVDPCPPTCSANPVVVTVTQQPQPGSVIETIAPEGTMTTVPASKFPCSSSDLKPCRGDEVQDWKVFRVTWTPEYPKPGHPKPYYTSSEFDFDTILTITDNYRQSEHFVVKMDDEVLGETHENGFDAENMCQNDGDVCIAKGFSHGSFLVPKGKHEFSFDWTEGPQDWPNLKPASSGGGLWRFDKPCECADADEGGELKTK